MDTIDQIDTAGTMESEGMASAIADNLQDAGFKRAEVDPADTEITTVEVSNMSGDECVTSRFYDILMTFHDPLTPMTSSWYPFDHLLTLLTSL